MQIEEDVSAEVDNILQELHNSSHHTKAEYTTVIVLSFNQNMFEFLTSVPPRRLSSKPWPVFRRSSGHKHNLFFLQILL